MLRWTVHLKGAPKVYDDAVVSAGDALLYSFGGCSALTVEQIHVNVFNAASLRWTRLPPVVNRRGRRPRRVPSWRYGHTAALIGNVVYVFGGFTFMEDFQKNRLYAFDVDTRRWFNPRVRVSGTVPKARGGHSACAVGTAMFVYGGDTWSDWSDDIYKLDTDTMVWSLVVARGTLPLASAWHSATAIGAKMLVFGGEGDAGTFNRVRVFDTQTNVWLRTPAGAQLLQQGHRKYHSAFAHGGELYVFGGKKRRRGSRCVWRFSPETSCWRKVEFRGRAPGNNWMCCCALGERVVLFGGYRGYHTVDDLFVLDFSPSLKTLCKLAVLQHRVKLQALPHNVLWELKAMTGGEQHGAAAAAKRKGKGKKRKTRSRKTQVETASVVAVVDSDGEPIGEEEKHDIITMMTSPEDSTPPPPIELPCDGDVTENAAS